ncbi:MAG: hypothetical protein A2958_00940 [Candidatus Levybacteria bacterium RIFCSPLOWO2_01_FULL_38_13]|nr:MAG: hypothetical protein A2629_00835 [Candidatus Levybacteria bacterium RIFCSPHIGHO2_01_FULL_41_15]OGH34853.1 MAG: hypothetical protein A2958_00940 [Candidatus Levybacteria bacterium RIFCSPLOWO2_01_FULL_38_13]
MPKKFYPSLNLLKDREEKFFDRFISWALTIGRLVVILTEIIALSAFIYRFTLDRQLIDLHSQIKQKGIIVSFLKNKEDTYRDLQGRLSITSAFSDSANRKVKILEDIIGFAPSGMSFNRVDILENRISVDANFQFISSLKSFVDSLKTYQNVESISINKIDNRLSSAVITVNITADLKK